MSQHHLIYIPGLGDSKSYGQSSLLKIWQLFGIKTHYAPVYWRVDEPFQAKLAKLTKLVDELSINGLVSIVGISAGASAAMNLLSARQTKIHKAVFVAGKLLYPETINEEYFRENPAFKESVFMADANFKAMTKAERQKMLSLYAIYDNTVPIKASQLPGVKHTRIIAVGHIPTIFTTLVFYGYSISRFIKS